MDYLSDESNADSDESTDKYISFNWGDMFGNWAGGMDPQTLANIKFELLDDVDLTSLNTAIRLQSSETTTGYNFYGQDIILSSDTNENSQEPDLEDGDDDLDEGSTEKMVSWEIHTIKIDELDFTKGYLSWADHTWTPIISGYEEVLGQDLDGDSFVGINTNDLGRVSTDKVGDQLKVSSGGTVYIWDGIDESADKLISVTDNAGGTPVFREKHEWEFGSFSMEPYAVAKFDGGQEDDYYRLLIKITDSFEEPDGSTNERVNWDIYKLSLDGVIDYSGNIFTESITSFEGPDAFDMDLNGDGDKSGKVVVNRRETDFSDNFGVSFGSDTDGSLYILDGKKQILINDSFIESSNKWGDGSFESTAIAAAPSIPQVTIS